jgi:hypothetical protein
MLVLTGMAYLLGALHAPCSTPTVVAPTAMMVGSSSSVFGGVLPLTKKAHPWSFFPMSTRYACDIFYWFTLFLLLLLLS